MVVRLLSKIQNGDGEFPTGSVLELNDSEATRLVKLKVAVSLEEEEPQINGPEINEDRPVLGLKEIPKIKDDTVEALTDEGIFTVQDLIERSVEDLILIQGIGVKTAERLIDAARDLLREEEEEEE